MNREWAPAFLAALAKGSSVSEAARAAGVSPSTVSARRKRDADFATAYDDAIEESADLLETEARRRAIDGVEEPVVYQGQLTPVWERDADGAVVKREVQARRYIDGAWVDVIDREPVQARDPDGTLRWLTVRKPSDALLALLLKGRRPAVFGVERKELSGPNGAPIAQQVVIATGVPDAPPAAMRLEDLA